MIDVWFRGPVRLDLLSAATIVSCSAWDRADLALEAFQAVEPGTIRTYNPGNPWSQRVYLLVSGSYVFVAIPGTESWQHWVGNVLGSGQIPAPAGPGRTANYWSGLAQGLYGLIRADLLAALPGRRLVVAGYSLGAAVAQILAALAVAETGAELRLHLFASPRAGDSTFADGLAPARAIRIEGPDDPVPFVPPRIWGGSVLPLPYPGPVIPVTYSQPGTGYALDAAGGLHLAGPGPSFGALSALLSGADPRQTHALETYTALLRAPLPTPIGGPGQMGYIDPAAIDRVLLALQNQSGSGWGIPAPPPPGLPTLAAQAERGGGIMWRATFYHEIPSGEVSESYYQDSDSVDKVALAADTLAKLRINLMGTGCKITGVRISDTALFRDYGLFPLNYETGLETGDDLMHVKPFMRVMCHMVNGPYRNRVFLSGVAQKNYLGDKKLNLTTSFNKSLKEWAEGLRLGGWQMAVQGRFGADLTGGNVAGASATAPIILETEVAHGFTKNQEIVVRGVKGNKGANGRYAVQVVDATHLRMLNSIGTGEYTTGGKWRLVKTVFKSIDKVIPVKETSRKAGRPSA